MNIIEIDHLTKDYGHNRGVFDVTFSVQKGEVYGFLGPNGAGKTSAIRHIMGFSKPHQGRTSVNGLDSWTNAHDIQKKLGYLPGEIAFPENLTGTAFIQMMADLRNVTDMKRTTYLLERFELDPSGSLKRMSLGEKRKLAIVTAFMHDPDVLILDEPTSGLDPIMQDLFIDFIKEEKQRGKTILLSSHIFSEIEATCDKISIIKDGRLVSSFVADELRQSMEKTYSVIFQSAEVVKTFNVHGFKQTPGLTETEIHIHIKNAQINDLIAALANYDLYAFSEIPTSLEDYFMHFYDRNEKENELV
jgi:ABC-2 type transport system ATP-binding protein